MDNRAVTQQQTPTREREKAQSSSGRQQHLQASRFNDVQTDRRPPQNIVTPYVEIRPQDRVTPQAVDFEESNKLAHTHTLAEIADITSININDVSGLTHDICA